MQRELPARVAPLGPCYAAPAVVSPFAAPQHPVRHDWATTHTMVHRGCDSNPILVLDKGRRLTCGCGSLVPFCSRSLSLVPYVGCSRGTWTGGSCLGVQCFTSTWGGLWTAPGCG